MHRLNSSFRTKSPSETLILARSYFDRLGISRLTETTRLDKIGMPVAVAIRPSAKRGSLIVTAGKGLTSEEALTGAAMEAIELACSDGDHSKLKIDTFPASRILQSLDDISLLDLCPILGAEIDLDEDMSMVHLLDIIQGKMEFLPAELLFIPFLHAVSEKKYFGYHTNGLASGNTYEEAIIHAIFEIVERDILSFEFIKESGVDVLQDTMPVEIKNVIKDVQRAGLKIEIKTVDNPHLLPFFKVYIQDPWAADPTFRNAGYGCHSDKSISLMRAISEAAQSRMSYIHGGREDLTKGLHRNVGVDYKKENRHLLEEHPSSSIEKISFSDIHQPVFEFSDPIEFLDLLKKHLLEQGLIENIYVARHTSSEEPLQVVKVVIPKLEFFNHETRRIGPRMQVFLNSLSP